MGGRIGFCGRRRIFGEFGVGRRNFKSYVLRRKFGVEKGGIRVFWEEVIWDKNGEELIRVVVEIEKEDVKGEVGVEVKKLFDVVWDWGG